jgi:hypothetical protein
VWHRRRPHVSRRRHQRAPTMMTMIRNGDRASTN